MRPLLALGFAASAYATTYNVIKEYAGPRFFDDWVFYGNYDNLTNGDAIFVPRGNATQLAYVDSTTNHAIIRVDNTTNVPYNYKRNTVRITTTDSFGVGSVWVADIYHLPFGCSVWPAWWSQAPTWPTGGEIDTIEGVNLQSQNQMSLHTLSGCTINQSSPTAQTGIVQSTDCSNATNSNQGCIIKDTRTDSLGQGFAAAGGGLFVTELATTGINIWFFPRANVPSSLTSNASSIDTSALGLPTGNWPTTTCSTDEFFSAQNLIFDITLCGDFAGAPAIFNQTCTGQCYTDFVIGNGSDYANAYFEVAYVRVFSTSSNNTNNTTSSGSGGKSDAGAGSNAIVWASLRAWMGVAGGIMAAAVTLGL